MRFLHLMKSEKFTKGIAMFYDKYFNNGQHEICYLNKYGFDSLVNNDLSIAQSEVFLGKHNRFKIIKLLNGWKKYDYIIMHSLFFCPILLALDKKILRKLIWIEWGYDLYNWNCHAKKIKEKIKKWGEKRVRKECRGFVGIFPPDCNVYREKFPNSKTKIFYAPYCGGEIPKEYFNYNTYNGLEEKLDSNEEIYIQIGHSAVKSVNHISVLENIKHLSGENIKIIIPLSYGDMKYGDMVQRRAEELFPQKTICLREMLTREEYFKLISKVDIAIFDTLRQIALGNINRMIFRNVKIYMNPLGVMYDYFINKGVPIQDVNKLNNITMAELKSPVKTQKVKTFNRFIKSFSDMEDKVDLWKSIFSDLEKGTDSRL